MTAGQLTEYLLLIQEAVGYLKLTGINEENLQVVDDVIDAISNLESDWPRERIDADSIKSKFLKAKTDRHLPDDISKQFQGWCSEVMEKCCARSSSTLTITQPKCDVDFQQLILKIEQTDTAQLLEEASESAEKLLNRNKSYYDLLRHWYLSWFRVETFNYNDPAFVRHFGSLYQYLKDNTAGLRDFYQQLMDYRSKYSLMMLLQNWLTFTPDLRFHGVEHTFPHYFDLDLLSCDADEVFVDCGAFNGDSIISFIKTFGSEYKRIYAYELTPKTYETLQNNLKSYHNIIYRNAGVADINASFPMHQLDEGNEAGNRLMLGGNTMMPVVTLDSDIQEDITFIKMDIEGAETAALTGARNHIRRSHPKLAISLYHTPNHLLEVPDLIREIDPSYQFFLRHTGQPVECGVPFPTEYILIAK